jgi:putative NADPH-quinone reductase
MRIAIIQGHPDSRGGHYCHALADAYAAGARAAGHEPVVLDVGQLDFPFVRSREDLDERPAPEAIRRAQDMLLGVGHVVLIFPVWNGAMPALLKGFLEQTFRSSFIFPDVKPGERLGFASFFTKRKALAGRSGRIIATMQMPAWVYRWYYRPHPEKNTLRVGGIGPVRETLIGNVEVPDGREREKWLDKVADLGRRAA